jgi:hypothetical protein
MKNSYDIFRNYLNRSNNFAKILPKYLKKLLYDVQII